MPRTTWSRSWSCARGAMTLIDEERSAFLYRRLGPAREVSGGSCANTIAAVASLGGRGAYHRPGPRRPAGPGVQPRHPRRRRHLPQPAQPDRPGHRDQHDLRHPRRPAHHEHLPGRLRRARAPTTSTPSSWPAPRITYLEGYLWDRPEAKAACRKAADVCHQAGKQLALTLSDALLRRPLAGRVPRADRAAGRHPVRQRGRDHQPLRGRRLRRRAAGGPPPRPLRRADPRRQGLGRACAARRSTSIDAVPPARVLDTTGAGDLYAAGFLRGLTMGLDLAACGRLGSACAAEIIAQYGARPERPLLPLLDRAGVDRLSAGRGRVRRRRQTAAQERFAPAPYRARSP